MKKNICVGLLLLSAGAFLCANAAADNAQTIQLVANKGVQLPITKYPEPGQSRAFKLIKPDGTSVDIIIKGEVVSDALLNDVSQKADKETNSQRKGKFANMLKTMRRHKEKKRGVHAIYRVDNTPQGKKLTLIQMRSPGVKESGEEDDTAMIVATPKGNLQVFEDSQAEPGKKEVVELATGTKA